MNPLSRSQNQKSFCQTQMSHQQWFQTLAYHPRYQQLKGMSLQILPQLLFLWLLSLLCEYQMVPDPMKPSHRRFVRRLIPNRLNQSQQMRSLCLLSQISFSWWSSQSFEHQMVLDSMKHQKFVRSSIPNRLNQSRLMQSLYWLNQISFVWQLSQSFEYQMVPDSMMHQKFARMSIPNWLNESLQILCWLTQISFVQWSALSSQYLQQQGISSIFYLFVHRLFLWWSSQSFDYQLVQDSMMHQKILMMSIPNWLSQLLQILCWLSQKSCGKRLVAFMLNHFLRRNFGIQSFAIQFSSYLCPVLLLLSNQWCRLSQLSIVCSCLHDHACLHDRACFHGRACLHGRAYLHADFATEYS